MMIRICCVCQKRLGTIDDGKREERLTHTYCEPCAREAIDAIDNGFQTINDRKAGAQW